MHTDIHWVETSARGRLAIMARPRGGDWLNDEVANWRAAGVDIVLSLITRDEARELDLDSEPDLCAATGIEFLTFPIPDREVPASEFNARKIARHLASTVAEGRSIAIHCRAGIGRSALMAACVLVELGELPDKAFESIGRARGMKVPDTEEQRRWLAHYALGAAR
jgi:protein-tyrosine phosphatase